MAVRLRLMRMGKKKQPTYRIVAADSRSPRDGRFLEIIGTYDPRREPSAVKVDNDAALKWLQEGARPSEAVEKLLRISGAWESYTTGAPLPAADEPAAVEPAADEPAAAEPAADESTADEPAAPTTAEAAATSGDEGSGEGEEPT